MNKNNATFNLLGKLSCISPILVISTTCISLNTSLVEKNLYILIGIYATTILFTITNLLSSFFHQNERGFRINIIDISIVLIIVSSIGIGCILGHNTLTSGLFLVTALINYVNFRMFLTFNSGFKNLVLNSFILLSLSLSAWGWLQLLGILPSNHSFFKATGPFGNPGPFAGYLSILLPILLNHILQHKSPKIQLQKVSNKNLVSTIFLIMSYLSFFSIILLLPVLQSRASWLSAFIGMIFILYILNRKKKEILILSIVIIIIAIPFLYSLKKESADGRWLILKLSTPLIIKKPLGLGMGRFKGAIGNEQYLYFKSGQGNTQELKIADSPAYAFNSFVQVALELGVVSLALLIYIFVVLIYRNNKVVKNLGFKGSLLSSIVFGLMSYPFSLPCFIITLTILFALINDSLISNSLEKEAKSFNIQAFRILSLMFILSLFFAFPIFRNFLKVENANQLIKRNEHFKAAKMLKEVTAVIKDNPDILFLLGKTLNNLGNYSESTKYLEKATLYNNDPMIYNLIGKNYQKLELYDLAEHNYLKASYIIPNRIYPHYLLANCYLATGDTLKAVEKAIYVLNLDSKIPSVAENEIKMEMRKLVNIYLRKPLTEF